jgi:hypothetical protein
VWGPAQTSVSGHRFYVSFVDAYSRFTWLYLLKHKSDVYDVFLQFQKHVERLLNRKIIHVQSDWGVNMRNFTLSFMVLVYLIVCHILTLINRMALLNANIVTLLGPVLLCLHMLLFLCVIGMMRLLLHVF